MPPTYVRYRRDAIGDTAVRRAVNWTNVAATSSRPALEPLRPVTSVPAPVQRHEDNSGLAPAFDPRGPWFTVALGRFGSADRAARQEELGVANLTPMRLLHHPPGDGDVPHRDDSIASAGGTPRLVGLAERGLARRHGRIPTRLTRVSRANFALRPPAVALSPILQRYGASAETARIVVIHRAIRCPQGMPREGCHRDLGSRPPIGRPDGPLRARPELHRRGLPAILASDPVAAPETVTQVR